MGGAAESCRRSMNEFALIFEFAREPRTEVEGRGAALSEGDRAAIARVVRGESTTEQRRDAAILMRDHEEALLLFVSLLRERNPDDSEAE